METFVTVERARELIGLYLPPPVPSRIPLDEALGAVIQEDVVSRENIPSFPNSAMDGFAVRSTDLAASGGTLDLLGQVQAGEWPSTEVIPGGCIRIMTGAPVPQGADAVVPVEWTSADGNCIAVDRGVDQGRNIRLAGEDIKEGDIVLRAGSRIDPARIAVLATLGFHQVLAAVPPRVAVVSTGDELVDASETPGPGQIRNSNGPALSARVRQAGCPVLGPLHADDSRESLREVIERALQADLMVFSGGVSMGDYDLVKDVLLELGLELAFWKVRQRPGKPLAFGILRGKPVFGLPGNPVSSSVCFDQYVRPALAVMQGGRDEVRTFKAMLSEPFTKADGLHVFARGIVWQDTSGQLLVRQTGAQGSNLSTSLVKANCVVHIPSDWTSAPEGRMVTVELT